MHICTEPPTEKLLAEKGWPKIWELCDKRLSPVINFKYRFIWNLLGNKLEPSSLKLHAFSTIAKIHFLKHCSHTQKKHLLFKRNTVSWVCERNIHHLERMSLERETQPWWGECRSLGFPQQKKILKIHYLPKLCLNWNSVRSNENLRWVDSYLFLDNPSVIYLSY